jgi:hypothetical protein
MFRKIFRRLYAFIKDPTIFRVPIFLMLATPFLWWFCIFLTPQQRRDSRYIFSTRGALAILQSLIYGSVVWLCVLLLQAASQRLGMLSVFSLLLFMSLVMLIFSCGSRLKVMLLFSCIWFLILGSGGFWITAHLGLVCMSIFSILYPVFGVTDVSAV